jgi:two-component system cell cycle sensor histidine kinase/response regulator CckA
MNIATVVARKILVVEDDHAIRAATVRLLTSAGYQVFEAENGARGFEEALAVRPDLILSDVAMPELDGIELCRRVRANPDLKTVLFIFVSSARTRSNEQADGLDVGAEGYIARPVSNRELLSRVSALIRIVDANARANGITLLAAGRERLARQVLESLNDPTGTKNAIRDILRAIKKANDFEAMAIRLREGEDFPYYETTGFSDDFVKLERTLCARDEAGDLVRAPQGTPILECMCGNILCGRPVPGIPHFTQDGSFWCNHRTDLLALSTEQEPKVSYRNRCYGMGYESVALIPLRIGNEIIGLLQINDHRPNRFTPELLHYLEGLSASIAIALGRKRADQAFRESENRFDQLAAHSRTIAWEVDSQGLYTYVSNVSAAVWGYRPDELVGRKHFYDLHPAESREEFKAAAFGVFARKESFQDLVNPMQAKDGHVVWVSTNGLPLLTAQGGLRGYRGSYADITERKRAEKEIALLKHSIDVHYDAAYWTDIDGKFIYVNEIGCKALGFGTGELVGKTILDVNPEATSERMKAVWDKLRKDGFHRGESIHQRQDGSAFPVEILTSYVRFDGEEYACGFARDITERKQAEAEKAKLEAQLQQAQKMESVGRLAGGVAHDFNNMLGVILGHVEMATETVGPAEESLRSNLEEIRKAAERSANLTRQLLAFARKQTVAPKVLDLNETVASMLKMLRRLVGEDVNLVWLPGAELYPLKVDPSQIDQILANLCVNARDAIGSVGKLTIETANCSFDADNYATHAEVVPGEYVKLAVTDDGCGMDKATQERLFEPFFTTKEQGKGTGLGLATVYGIVKQNNGFIKVASAPGKGATFEICLPRHVAAKAGPVQSDPSTVPFSRGHETILLVEDEPAILDMTKAMLVRLGYTVLASSTPGEAIRLAGAYTGVIHLLMTDVVMPEMNGRDLAKTLLTSFPALKRLFMSGYTADVIAHQGVLDEGVHFIQKPFSKKDLAARVSEALEHGSTDRG